MQAPTSFESLDELREAAQVAKNKLEGLLNQKADIDTAVSQAEAEYEACRSRFVEAHKKMIEELCLRHRQDLKSLPALTGPLSSATILEPLAQGSLQKLREQTVSVSPPCQGADE